MFGFIKKMSFLVFNVLNPIPPKFVSMNNQECRIRPEIINTNSNEPTFYPYSIEVNKCGGSCNSVSDAYAKLCVPDVVKNINIKVFNLISRTIETRHIKWHKTCKCKCRLDASVYDNKERWNMINEDMNAKNCVIMEDVIKSWFGILIIMNVNVINYAMLESI